MANARNELLSDADKVRELTKRGIVVGAFVRVPKAGREGLVTEVGRGVKPSSRAADKQEDFYVTLRLAWRRDPDGSTYRRRFRYDTALTLEVLAGPDYDD